MDKQRLVQYLQNVVDLEKQVYLQKQALYQLDKKIKSLGHAGEISSVAEYNLTFWGALGRVGGFMLIGMLAGFMPIGCALGKLSPESFLFKLLAGSRSYLGAAGFVFSIVFPATIGAIVAIIVNIVETISNKKTNAKNEKRYNAAMHADAVRVNNELAQKKVLQQERSILYGRYQKTQETLRRFYDVGVIYGKYRYDFAAVASFLDYFQSGRCSTLGENRGGDGAYNLYESELRQNVIINKLDQVLSKLDQIRDNQYSLACAIQEGNRISQKLVKATERLAIAGEQTARNSEIAAYNSQQSAIELNQIKWLQLYGMTLR